MYFILFCCGLRVGFQCSRVPEEDTKPEIHGEPSRQFNNQGSSHHWHLRTLEDPLIQRSHRWWYHIGSLLGINWGNCRFIKGYCYLQCVCEQADLLDLCASLIICFFWWNYSVKKKVKHKPTFDLLRLSFCISHKIMQSHD